MIHPILEGSQESRYTDHPIPVRCNLYYFEVAVCKM